MADRDRVIAGTTTRGTQLDEFFGVPTTGNAIEFTGIRILRIADGLIGEH